MSEFAAVLLLLVSLGGACFLTLGALLATRWRRTVSGEENRELPPITLLRPLKSRVPHLRDKLERLARALRPGDQLIIGAEADSAEAAVAASVQAAFPEVEIAVVTCKRGAALNPKISKLLQMMPLAQHEHVVLSDSETIIDAPWLDGFRDEWAAGEAEVLTCGYRFTGLVSWPQRLDAAAALLALWPGLLMVQRFARLRFTMGACTAFRRSQLVAAGGWEAFAEFLAEDHRLGAAFARQGAHVQLSRHIATLESDPLSWRDYWRRQRRVAVTYRVCQPAGFAGTVLTHGATAWLLLGALALRGGSELRDFFWMAAAAETVRCGAAWQLSRALRFPFRMLPWTLIPAGLVESACWALSWGASRVWWSGCWWQVAADGRLTGRDRALSEPREAVKC